MKKFMVLAIVLLSVTSFSEMKNVIMYENDVSTGKVIDNRPEATKKYKEKWLQKTKRYQELDKKKNLTKKEQAEKEKLGQEILIEYKRTNAHNERTVRAQSKNVENEVINKMTSERAPETPKKKKSKVASFLGI